MLILILQKYPTNLVSIRTRPFLQFIWTFGCITLIFGTSRVVQSWVWVWLEPRTRWSHCVMELRLPTFCVCCHSCCWVFDSVQWLVHESVHEQWVHVSQTMSNYACCVFLCWGLFLSLTLPAIHVCKYDLPHHCCLSFWHFLFVFLFWLSLISFTCPHTF